MFSSRSSGGRRREVSAWILLWASALLIVACHGKPSLPFSAERLAESLAIPDSTRPEIRAEDLEHHVRALTDDRMRGRATGRVGEIIAADYIARVMQALDLESVGGDAHLLHRFEFTAGVSLGADNRLDVAWDPDLDANSDPSAPRAPTNDTPVPDRSAPTRVDHDWRPLAFSRSGPIEPGPIVCVGYGIVAPDHEDEPALDAYSGIDVEDRWVLVFRDLPPDLEGSTRAFLRLHASLRYKAMIARDRGARGVLFVSGPRGEFRNELVPLRFDASLAGTRLPVLSISNALAERLLAGSGRSLLEVQRASDFSRGAAPGFDMPGARVGAHIELVTERAQGRNVIGRLQVGSAPSAQTVVLGAHFDHLGDEASPTSLASGAEIGQIHSGADDNASGVALLLEIAEALTARKRIGASLGERDYVFAAWSGEELGLLGSDRWVADFANPHSRETGPVAYLNFDMVGRLRESLIVQGLGSSPNWEGLIDEARRAAPELTLQPHQESYLPTDSTSFYTKGIPVLNAFTGAHSDYHRPTDRIDKLNLIGTAQIGRLFLEIATRLSGNPEILVYRASREPTRGSARGGFRVFLGTIPDYARTDLVGVALSGVAPAGPAENAGLRGGDVIVEVDGRTIENLYDYTFALQAMRPGKATQIVVQRAGKMRRFEVFPGSRD